MGPDVVKLIIQSVRIDKPEEFEVQSVPRIGELVRTREMAAARVLDVIWDLVSGTATLHVR
jgi:hypothetical protein